MKEFWNERYSQEAYQYGTIPNAYFVAQLAKLPKGKILLPAEGEGRNAVYAAKQGWDVTAFDFSEEGQKKALKLAKHHGVEIDYQLIDASNYKASDSYNTVALIYAHFSGQERTELFRKVEESISNGGNLIIEVYSKNQLGRDSGGPKDLELLFSVEEIESLFPSLKFSILEEVEVDLNEGKHHTGKAMVIRAVAQKAN